MVPYKIMTDMLSDNLNKSQYFNPFFSWVVVVYTYYSIGINGGSIWKYLYYNATVGFIAICISMTYSMAEGLNYKYETFIKLIWIEELLWNINEWGYVFINFIKIRTCIKSLKKRYWMGIIYTLFFYTLIVRSYLCHLDHDYKLNKYLKGGKLSDEEEKTYSKSSNICNSFLYFPLGVVCVIFIYFIFVEFIKEDDKNTKNVLSILLHSTLSRMLLVSFIFVGMSLIVQFSKDGFTGFIRRLLWRLKGSLGIIFLVDILLLRIDLDQNQISLQKEEIEKISLTKSMKHRSFEYPYKSNIQNANDFEYATLLLNKDGDGLASPDTVTLNNNDVISTYVSNNNNQNIQNVYENDYYYDNNIFNYQHGLPYTINPSPNTPPSITVSLNSPSSNNQKKYPGNIVLESDFN